MTSFSDTLSHLRLFVADDLNSEPVIVVHLRAKKETVKLPLSKLIEIIKESE